MTPPYRWVEIHEHHAWTNVPDENINDDLKTYAWMVIDGHHWVIARCWITDVACTFYDVSLTPDYEFYQNAWFDEISCYAEGEATAIEWATKLVETPLQALTAELARR